MRLQVARFEVSLPAVREVTYVSALPAVSLRLAGFRLPRDSDSLDLAAAAAVVVVDHGRGCHGVWGQNNQGRLLGLWLLLLHWLLWLLLLLWLEGHVVGLFNQDTIAAVFVSCVQSLPYGCRSFRNL